MWSGHVQLRWGENKALVSCDYPGDSWKSLENQTPPPKKKNILTSEQEQQKKYNARICIHGFLSQLWIRLARINWVILFFFQMRDLVNSRLFLLRKKLDNFLYWLLPNTWIPLYTMVSSFHITLWTFLTFNIDANSTNSNILSADM